MQLPKHPLRRRRSAAAAAELAVFMPVLAVLILGCIDFGRFAYSHIALTNAARSAAFYGAMNPFTSTTPATWLSNMRTQARHEMDGQTGYTSTDLTIDQTAWTGSTTDSNGNTVYSNSDVRVTVEKTTGERRVKVTAHLTFNTLILYPGLPSTITMQRAVEMRSVR